MTPNLTFELVGDTDVVITRHFKATPQQVFDAHHTPDLVRQWMLGPPGWTMPVCEIAPQVGAKVEFRWQNEDGESFGLTGVINELDIPHRSVHTELFDFPGATGTEVQTLYKPHETGTELVVRIRYASAEVRKAALDTGMADGMEASYARIDSLF